MEPLSSHLEIKGLFCYPGITPKLSSDGLNEIFSLGPARTPGNGVFDGVFEVPPAHCLIAAPEGTYQKPYWRSKLHPHEDDDKTTIEKISFLFQDAVERQMKGTAPFLFSGGVDSSLVSAICAKILQKKGERLTTFSFDFSENSRYFQSNAFQPSLLSPYVDQMVSFLDSDHHYLECFVGNPRRKTDRLRDCTRPACHGRCRFLHALFLLTCPADAYHCNDRRMCR